MIPKNELHAVELYEMSLESLQKHLTLDIEGYRCTIEMALTALVKAAVDNSSLNAVCDNLEGMSDGNTIREHLNAALDVSELTVQEIEMNAALSAGLPDELPRGGMEVAIDFHDEPFYGKTPEVRPTPVATEPERAQRDFCGLRALR